MGMRVQKKLSMDDIARVAGVGRGTVSRALNNQPGVSAKKRELVARIMAEHGYQPNVLARGLAAKQTRNIEVVFNTSSPKISNEPIVLQLLDGMLPEMAERRYMLFFSALSSDFAVKDVQADVFGKRGHTDGLILVTNRMEPGFLKALKQTVAVPLVVVDYCANVAGVGCVTNDNHAGAYNAVKHLYELGHRRIGFIGDRGMLQPVRMRLEGYKAALVDLKLAVRDEFVALADSVSPDTRSIEALLSAKSRPDAIFAATEDMIPEIMAIAARLGIRVPEQVNLAGFGSASEVTLTGAPLPTIILQWERIGREAVRMLVDAIEKGQRMKKVLIAPEWVCVTKPEQGERSGGIGRSEGKQQQEVVR